MSSNAWTYTAGFERGVRPREDWSTIITESIDCQPVSLAKRASNGVPPSLSSRAGSSPSRMSVVLPEPLTPVTQTNLPSGISTVKSIRLCRVNFVRRSRCVRAVTLRAGGDSSCLRPERYAPVSEALHLAKREPAPSYTIFTAALAAFRAEVNDVIGPADDAGLVLNDDQSIAEVAQVF
ncbi:MAG: hypothetical protein CM1200mP29_12720 [Verrucomicrobiota bacterium]|nr:MAG: hypothetical protein CM1200mP29_12720 [Verrucomicrobiota bacterium]